MGAFIPSQPDMEICDFLTKRFSDQPIRPPRPLTFIGQLRNHAEKLFDARHHLHRVAHRLAVSVTGGSVPPVRKHRLRWFHLLHRLLPPETDAAIRQVLTAVLDPANNIDYATFSTRPAPIGVAFELYPENSGQPYVQIDANGKRFCQLILECRVDQPLPDPQPGTEADPPDRDTGEDPLPTLVKRRRKRRKVVKKPARKSVKKSKSAKKSTPKKSKKKSSAKKSSSKKKSARKSSGKKAVKKAVAKKSSKKSKSRR